MIFFKNSSHAEYEKIFYDFKINGIAGEVIDLKDFKGKPVLIVNTASYCGFTKQYDDLYKIEPSEIPTDIQVMINNNEKGAALIRLAEVIGQDEIDRIDEDTIYFIITALNKLNIDWMRNKILLKVLPLKV